MAQEGGGQEEMLGGGPLLQVRRPISPSCLSSLICHEPWTTRGHLRQRRLPDGCRHRCAEYADRPNLVRRLARTASSWNARWSEAERRPGE